MCHRPWDCISSQTDRARTLPLTQRPKGNRCGTLFLTRSGPLRHALLVTHSLLIWPLTLIWSGACLSVLSVCAYSLISLWIWSELGSKACFRLNVLLNTGLTATQCCVLLLLLEWPGGQRFGVSPVFFSLSCYLCISKNWLMSHIKMYGVFWCWKIYALDFQFPSTLRLRTNHSHCAVFLPGSVNESASDIL